MIQASRPDFQARPPSESAHVAVTTSTRRRRSDNRRRCSDPEATHQIRIITHPPTLHDSSSTSNLLHFLTEQSTVVHDIESSKSFTFLFSSPHSTRHGSPPLRPARPSEAGRQCGPGVASHQVEGPNHQKILTVLTPVPCALRTLHDSMRTPYVHLNFEKMSFRTISTPSAPFDDPMTSTIESRPMHHRVPTFTCGDVPRVPREKKNFSLFRSVRANNLYSSTPYSQSDIEHRK